MWGFPADKQQMACLDNSSSNENRPSSRYNLRSQPKNTELRELLAEGLLLEAELTRRQRTALHLNDVAPNLTNEQKLIIHGRKLERGLTVPSSEKQLNSSLTLAELQDLLADGLLSEDHLTSGQKICLALGNPPPALTNGQQKLIKDNESSRAAKSKKSIKVDEAPKTQHVRTDELIAPKGQGVPRALLQKIVDNGLIHPSELFAKQRQALEYGYSESRRFNESQLALIKKRSDKQKFEAGPKLRDISSREEPKPGKYDVSHALAKINLNREHQTQHKLDSGIALPSYALSPFGNVTDNVSSRPIGAWSNIYGPTAQTTSTSQRAQFHTSAPRKRSANSSRPHPTSEYLQQASAQPVKLDTPQPLLVISDLNGTLGFKKKSPGSKIKARPGLTDFLCYVLNLEVPETCSYTQMPMTRDKDFVFMVWTSAQPKTASRALSTMCDPVFQSRIQAVWARDTLGLTKNEYNRKTQVYKKLQVVWQNMDIQKSHPRFAHGSRWNQTNTVLIDDSSLKAITEPFNLINIPELTQNRFQQEQTAALKAESEFDKGRATDIGDRSRQKNKNGERGILQLVAQYLDEARWYADVSAYIRCNPFSMTFGLDDDVEMASDDLEIIHDDDGMLSSEDDEEDDGGVRIG